MRICWGGLLLLLVWLPLRSVGQPPAQRPRQVATSQAANHREQKAAVIVPTLSAELRIAARFAPTLFQGLGDDPRADYLAAFDFDGDWRGDNNWDNLDNRKFALRGVVYYAVSETTTHYFVHYAFFHPRDYKGTLAASTILAGILRETLPALGKDSETIAEDIALSHENDLEGCLVVAAKRGNDLERAEVQFVETMSHNRFLRYRTLLAPNTREGDLIELDEDRHPRLFIEPKGHGVERFTGDRTQLNRRVLGLIEYVYAGIAESPEELPREERTRAPIGYDLVSLYDTFWTRAQKGENEMYGEQLDYQTRAALKFDGEKQRARKVERKFGTLGANLRGNVGFKNKARAPWAWYDDRERDRPRGEWFFDPAAVIARHFDLGETFSLSYLYHQYFGIDLHGLNATSGKK